MGVNTIHTVKANPVEEAVIIGATMDRFLLRGGSREAETLEELLAAPEI